MNNRINIHIESDSAEDAQSQMRKLLAGDGLKTSTDGTQSTRRDPALEAATSDGVGSKSVKAAAEAPAKKSPFDLEATPAAKAEAEKPAKGGKKKSKFDKVEETLAKTSKDTAADKAADADDESAETASEDDDKLTHDDVRAALGKYVTLYGTDAAMEDGPKLLGLIFDGQGIEAISDIPDDQEALQEVIDGVDEMIEKNPFKRKAAKAAK